MTLTDARAWVRQFARNAGESVHYDNTQVDRAVAAVGERFCRVTQYLKAVASVALADGVAAADYTAVTDFRPERILAAWISDPPANRRGRLELADHAAVLDLQQERAYDGVPEKLAFSDATTGSVYPTPDAAYTLKTRYWQPFTAFTPGTATPGSVTLNLPDRVLAEILPVGPPALLQHNEPEMQYASRSWAKYLEVEASYKGAGGLGGRSAAREMVVD